MLKVLITDDEQMICNLIANILDWEDMGFQIIGMANTGTDAFDIIQKEKPDVVISDIRMPGYDGIQLIQKTAEAGIQAVFVMISGYKQFEYAQNAMKYGVKYYLLKPISEEKLRETMTEIGRELDVKQQKIVEERFDLPRFGRRRQHEHVGVLHRLADEVHRLPRAPGHGGHEEARHIVGGIDDRRSPQIEILQHQDARARKAVAQAGELLGIGGLGADAEHGNALEGLLHAHADGR